MKINKELRKTAKQKKFDSIQNPLTIDTAAEYLNECRKNNENVYIVLNGNTYYSCDELTTDDIYMQAEDVTKADFDAFDNNRFNAKTPEERQKVTNDFEDLKESNRKIKRDNAEAVELPANVSTKLEDVVKYLNECNNRGENVYITVGPKKLYACDRLSYERAHLEVTGMTEEQREKFDEKVAKGKTPAERSFILRHNNYAEQNKEMMELDLSDKSPVEVSNLLSEYRLAGYKVCAQYKGTQIYSEDRLTYEQINEKAKTLNNPGKTREENIEELHEKRSEQHILEEQNKQLNIDISEAEKKYDGLTKEAYKSITEEKQKENRDIDLI